MMGSQVHFVVGAGRSGTTLLGALLAAEPSVVCLPEAPFAPWLLRRPWRVGTVGGRWDRPGMARLLRRSPSFNMLALDPADVHSVLRASLNGRSALDALLDLYVSERGGHVRIDQTPSNVLRLRLMASQYPDAKFVHLVRDGRHVALSLLRIGWSKSPEDAAFNWMRRAQAGLEATPLLGSRLLTVRYEQLVANPEPVVALVQRHFGLDVGVDWERYRASAASLVASSQFPDAHRRLGSPVALRDERVVTQVTRRIEAIQWDLLLSAGYETWFDAPSRAARRRRMLLAQIPWELRRARRRLTVP